MTPPPPTSTLFPYTTLFRSLRRGDLVIANDAAILPASLHGVHEPTRAHIEIRLAARRSLAVDDVKEFLAIDRKSTRLNSSHLGISYAVFCLKKKKKQ